jgi:hypothetical protein
MFQSLHGSDDEYVTKCRSTLLFWDRFRYAMFALFAACLVAVIWLSVQVVPMINAIGQGNRQMAWLGFSTGAVIGLVLATIFHNAVFGMIFTVGGFRSERLMLKYYDLLQQHETSGNDAHNDTRDGIAP